MIGAIYQGPVLAVGRNSFPAKDRWDQPPGTQIDWAPGVGADTEGEQFM